MMHQTEHDIQTAIAEALIWDGWLVLRLNSGAMRPGDSDRYVRFYEYQALGYDPAADGVSDLIAFRAGETAFIEIKRPKGQQRESQKRFEAVCESIGVEYVLARDLSDIAHLLTRVEVGGRPGMRAVEANKWSER